MSESGVAIDAVDLTAGPSEESTEEAELWNQKGKTSDCNPYIYVHVALKTQELGDSLQNMSQLGAWNSAKNLR